MSGLCPLSLQVTNEIGHIIFFVGEGALLGHGFKQEGQCAGGATYSFNEIQANFVLRTSLAERVYTNQNNYSR